MKAIGCDILSLSRFNRMVNSHDESTLSFLFTESEFDWAKRSDNKLLFLAVCFSGKEAVSKALGQGMAGIHWNEIEILPGFDGTANVKVYQKAKDLAESISIVIWKLFWTLSEGMLFVLVDAA